MILTIPTAMKHFFALCTLLSGAQCLQWAAGLEDGFTVYVCEGQVLTLPWNITPDKKENIINIKWFFSAKHSSDKKNKPSIIAAYSHQTVFPEPSYSQRMHHVPNGGLEISHVARAEAGNYTVEVTLVDARGVQMTVRRTAVVNLAWAAAAVELLQLPKAVFNEKTGEYHVLLSCTSRGRHPPTIIWTTPHKTFESSNKVGNAFCLLLRNPVSGGNYTCRILPDYYDQPVCPTNDTTLDGDTIFVDKMEARWIVMEAQLSALSQTNTDLKQRMSALESQQSSLRQENYNVKTDNYYLKDRVWRLENSWRSKRQRAHIDDI